MLVECFFFSGCGSALFGVLNKEKLRTVNHGECRFEEVSFYGKAADITRKVLFG